MQLPDGSGLPFLLRARPGSNLHPSISKADALIPQQAASVSADIPRSFRAAFGSAGTGGVLPAPHR